ncbi:hypothetical protein J437_LFUL005346 [Ladona fulva]|uniref:Uncharacterized protein n=1 Tax=Ladona fulva TaxID=123851 RepID=A0A8K0JZ64_LADFU|nr:hypothetical protein J437_LFUL005346 [Ladona fulva]
MSKGVSDLLINKTIPSKQLLFPSNNKLEKVREACRTGNELADSAAKEALAKENIDTPLLAVRDLQNMFHQITLKQWHDSWLTIENNKLREIKSIPRPWPSSIRSSSDYMPKNRALCSHPLSLLRRALPSSGAETTAFSFNYAVSTPSSCDNRGPFRQGDQPTGYCAFCSLWARQVIHWLLCQNQADRVLLEIAASGLPFLPVQ